MLAVNTQNSEQSNTIVMTKVSSWINIYHLNLSGLLVN